MFNRSELRQIKRSRTKISGRRVITDDVKKLKSLKVTPDLPEEEAVNYYREPIWIEYYIPKESRFALETKYLFIKLIDPVPREGRDEVLRKAQSEDEFIDLTVYFEGNSPEAEIVKKSYYNYVSMIQTISDHIKMYRQSENPEYLITPVYLIETMMMYEPTLASLEYLGDYHIHNLHWLIRRLNKGQVEFSLEDRTILLLTKRRNMHWEEKELPEDEEFELFAALFFEQAYPHRGAVELDKDDYL